MRNIVSLAILLYVSLLCSIQPGHAYDTRLSPLADSPFYAISPSLSSSTIDVTAEDNHEHEPGIISVNVHSVPFFSNDIVSTAAYVYLTQLYASAYARGPPLIPHC